MWWSPNTIKPNPLSSLTLLKRHHLTLFPYYHPCQKSKFSHQFLPKKKKFPSSHQHPSLYAISQKTKKKKGESLYAKCVSPFGCRETRGKITKTLVSFFFFFKFGFYIEFLIELLKKIKALLFFEIKLVCGIRLYF